MKRWSFVIFLILVAASLQAQTWRQVATATYPYFADVFLVDTLRGWAVGSGGAIYATNDGGITWVPQASGTTADLKKVFFLNANVGFVGGYSRTLVKTADGGMTWQPTTVVEIPETGASIRGIQFTNALTGFLLSSESGKNGRVLKTVDGGNTWTTVHYVANEEFNAFSFNGSNGVVVGSSAAVLYYTTDGGQTWTKAPTPSLGGFTYTRSDIRAVHLFTPLVGYAVGWGSSAAGLQPSILLKTTNGGASWVYMTQDSADRTYDNLYAVVFKDTLTGVAAGGGLRGSVVLTTTDGGVHWHRANVPSGVTLYGVHYSKSLFLIVGSSGTIFRWLNLSGTPNLVTKIPGSTLYALRFVSAKVAYAAGYGGVILKTTNGGETWSGKYLYANGLSPNIQDIYFVDERNGYAACSYRMVAKTTDGGESWQMVLPDTVSATTASYGVYFTDNQNGTVVGQLKSGTDIIYHTTNGGQTWTIRTGVVNKALRAVAFGNALKGAAVGDGLKIVYTSNGGSTWSASSVSGVPGSLASSNLRDIAYLDSSTAVAVGNKIVLRSNDGGASWTFVDSAAEQLNRVSFRRIGANLVGCAVGNKSLLSTTNGASWTPYLLDTSVVNQSLYSCAVDYSGYPWIAGSNSSIYTSAPVTSVRDGHATFPQEIYLASNYPNPFNPATKIRYALPTAGRVVLNVYDLLGRHVCNLVNGFNSQGVHEVVFDGRGLPSGVYIYELRFGNAVARNKMLLLK